MPQTVFIQISDAGASTGPFDLYSDADSYTAPFETGISKGTLEAGYTSTVVPDIATTLRVQSDNAVCTNYQDIVLAAPVTTTTTTTLAGDPPTSTLTFDAYANGAFEFSLSAAIPSTNIVISYADVTASDGACSTNEGIDTLSEDIVILGGDAFGTVPGNAPFSCDKTNYFRGLTVIVNGVPKLNGQTIVVGGTTVTVSISNACEVYECTL